MLELLLAGRSMTRDNTIGRKGSSSSLSARGQPAGSAKKENKNRRGIRWNLGLANKPVFKILEMFRTLCLVGLG